jgi:predicted Zn finger-like uncharacterized protein
MALATRCPSCHALFRVVADQLKLRAGLVRCGACGHVFDAIGTLSYLDDASVHPAVTPAPTAPAPEAEAPPSTATVAETAVPVEAAPLEPPPVATELHEPAIARLEQGESPITGLQPETEVAGAIGAGDEPESTSAKRAEGVTAAAAEPKAEATTTTTAGASISESTFAPATGDADAELAEVEPAFLHAASRARSRAATIAYATGATLAAFALALQLVLLLRTEIAAQWPTARPLLVSLCQTLRCTVGWPMHGELLAVVGSELQSLPGTNALELTAVVRNRAAVTLALPALEVTLTDTQNRAVARRIFGPVDYLASNDAAARIAEGLQAGADMTVRITFEARGLNVAGFVVYPFYL